MKYNIRWVTEKFDHGEPMKFVFFWGHSAKNGEDVGKFVFSQWHASPFVVDVVEYKTAEHWMMAQKAELFGDHEIAGKILSTIKPGEVKELGRQIRNFDAAIWDANKYEIVRQGNFYKFSQNEKLKIYLLATAGRILVEASPADTIWGIGLAHDAPRIENPTTWKGSNLLGFALMEVRDELKL